jgi:hypothetical protein
VPRKLTPIYEFVAGVPEAVVMVKFTTFVRPQRVSISEGLNVLKKLKEFPLCQYGLTCIGDEGLAGSLNLTMYVFVGAPRTSTLGVQLPTTTVESTTPDKTVASKAHACPLPATVAAEATIASVVVLSFLNMLVPRDSKEAIYHPRKKSPPPTHTQLFLTPVAWMHRQWAVFERGIDVICRGGGR